MRILFMGTPEFAVISLDALCKSRHEVVAAVSQPDKPKGRGHKLMPPPVKAYALDFGITVYQPETLKDNAFLATLQELAPELIVVAAYGKKLPEYVLNYPKYGCINIHASLLPKYRGAAPIHRCIMNGETNTGVTIMYMAEGIDTGDMLLKSETKINENETTVQLHDRLASMGADALIRAIEGIEAGTIEREKQDDSLVCYASMINKQTALIDWSRSATEINNLVRAMNSWPLAYTYCGGNMMKIASTEVTKCQVGNAAGTPGQVLGHTTGEGLLVACGVGVIAVKEVQFEGKRLMGIDDYMKGNTIEPGTILRQTAAEDR